MIVGVLGFEHGAPLDELTFWRFRGIDRSGDDRDVNIGR